ncbi:MAG: hypothetical protein WC224_06485 [Sphaerochaetaceae bacterium]
MTELTKDVLTYQKLIRGEAESSGVSNQKLLFSIQNRSQIIIYEYPVRVKVLEEEEAVELLLIMIPRLKKMIEDFEYQGIAFETFLKRAVYEQVKFYKMKKKLDNRKYLYLTYPGDEIDYYMLAEPAYRYKSEKYLAVDNGETAPINWSSDTKASKTVKNLITKYPATKRRFCEFIVLNSHDLTPKQISFLADFMNMSEDKLADLVTKAHELSLKKFERSQEVAAIRNNHYLNCQFLSREISDSEINGIHPITLESLKKRYERLHALYIERCQEANARPNPVTHVVLSKLFKKPKGTIDSGMSAMKRTLKEIIDDEA